MNTKMETIKLKDRDGFQLVAEIHVDEIAFQHMDWIGHFSDDDEDDNYAVKYRDDRGNTGYWIPTPGGDCADEYVKADGDEMRAQRAMAADWSMVSDCMNSQDYVFGIIVTVNLNDCAIGRDSRWGYWTRNTHSDNDIKELCDDHAAEAIANAQEWLKSINAPLPELTK